MIFRWKKYMFFFQLQKEKKKIEIKAKNCLVIVSKNKRQTKNEHRLFCLRGLVPKDDLWIMSVGV